MSNASSCLSRATHYAALAERAEDLETRRACQMLAATWREMAGFAADFDRRPDAHAKQRIYELIDVIAEEQRKVA